MTVEHREDTADAADGEYEPPALVEYGKITAWTRGIADIAISIVL